MSNGLWAVVPAAGRGTRLGSPVPKQYLAVHDKPVILYTLHALLSHPEIIGVVVVRSLGDAHFWPGVSEYLGKPVVSCHGGESRAASVLCGLRALPSQVPHDAFVLVHDAVRPNLASEDISRCIAKATVHPDGAILATPLRDTVKLCGEDHAIAQTVAREHLWLALTPQIFRRNILENALLRAQEEGEHITDEAMAVERCGLHPLLVEGSDTNFKITTRSDLQRFAFVIEHSSDTSDTASSLPHMRKTTLPLGNNNRSSARPSSSNQQVSSPTSLPAPAFRVGTGYDIHALTEGDYVTLGGVRIPHHSGIKAHSDGDVVLHALCDALLGALALGDIGHHFPPSDARFAGMASINFWSACLERMRSLGWTLVNADVTIVCERPYLRPHVDEMRTQIAQCAQVSIDSVSIKATTNEGLDSLGRGEGIAAHAIVLVLRTASAY